MPLRYNKIKKSPQIFSRLFGISVSDFEEISQKVAPAWKKIVESKYKRPGRNYKMPLEERILMLLLYYRSYVTQAFLGYVFDIDDSRVCRIIRICEPILARIMDISKIKKISQEEIETLIIDTTEQPIERPQYDQKPYYSGKKKRHTLKTEIRITAQGRIIYISKTNPGSVHDFNLYKQEAPVSKKSRVFADSGYQGLDRLHQATEIPYKKLKNKTLDADETEYNRALSRTRVVVEHIFSQLKTFKILSDRYRNKRKRYNLKFNIIAGIVNMKNGFVGS